MFVEGKVTLALTSTAGKCHHGSRAEIKYTSPSAWQCDSQE